MRSLNILIAEDDDQNQAMMKLILSRQGHKVKSAWNGLSAVEAVKSEIFDLIFMDVRMPEMDGLEATRQIRLWEDNKKHIPIVILTGSVSENITEEYKNAGADTYILKPFDIKRISLLVEIIASESETDFPKENTLVSTTIETEIQLLDIQNSIIRFNNDTRFYIDNLHEFLESLPSRLENLDGALKSRNWNDLSTYAHNLKGVASNFGADQLAFLAGSLDKYSQDHKLRQASKTVREIHRNTTLLTEKATKMIDQQGSTNSNRWEGQ
ncbi:MAG: response regulator [Chloroflexi bacterium]|nr:response regulator [Chloroflexota bacterium]